MKAAWTTKPFADVVSSRGSGTGGLAQKQWADTGQFPVVGQGEGGIEGWTDREDLLLTPEPALVLYGGHTRRAKHVDFPFVPGPNVRILTPCPDLDSRFLFYFLTQLQIPSKGYADHFPLVRKCEVRFPSLPEQRRIVAILDEVFERLTATKDSSDAKRNAIATIRKSIYDFVMRGRRSWKACLLADSVVLMRNGINCKQSKNPIGSKVSRIESISAGRFDPTRAGYARLTDDQRARFRLLKGDILFSHINSPMHVGKTALFDEEEEVCHGVNLLLLRAAKNLLPAYLEAWLKYLFVSGYWVHRCKQSVNQASVNQRDVGAVEVCFPPTLPEQSQIVTVLNQVLQQIDELLEVETRRLAAIDDLKASLLHQAFTGQL